jgi:hypothetical protein
MCSKRIVLHRGSFRGLLTEWPRSEYSIRERTKSGRGRRLGCLIFSSNRERQNKAVFGPDAKVKRNVRQGQAVLESQREDADGYPTFSKSWGSRPCDSFRFCSFLFCSFQVQLSMLSNNTWVGRCGVLDKPFIRSVHPSTPVNVSVSAA